MSEEYFNVRVYAYIGVIPPNTNIDMYIILQPSPDEKIPEDRSLVWGENNLTLDKFTSIIVQVSEANKRKMPEKDLITALESIIGDTTLPSI